jgi:hypothetical protein
MKIPTPTPALKIPPIISQDVRLTDNIISNKTDTISLFFIIQSCKIYSLVCYTLKFMPYNILRLP